MNFFYNTVTFHSR